MILETTDMYVTIWSRNLNSSYWVIERTHAAFYCKTIIGISEVGQTTIINGREYGIFKENTNPNTENN